MRTTTVWEFKDGKLSGEVLEDGKYWQVPPFDFNSKGCVTEALLERLKIVQIEAQMDLDMGSE